MNYGFVRRVSSQPVCCYCGKTGHSAAHCPWQRWGLPMATLETAIMALSIKHAVQMNPDTDAPKLSREAMTAALQLQGWAPYRASGSAGNTVLWSILRPTPHGMQGVLVYYNRYTMRVDQMDIVSLAGEGYWIPWEWDGIDLKALYALWAKASTL